MELRNYQKEVIKKIMWAKNLEGNDIIAIAQGGGKSHIIAELAHRLNPVIVICPTKEVLEQNISKMEEYMPREEIGVFSASMNEKTIKNITFGTIQSMYKVPELFKGFKIVGPRADKTFRYSDADLFEQVFPFVFIQSQFYLPPIACAYLSTI